MYPLKGLRCRAKRSSPSESPGGGGTGGVTPPRAGLGGGGCLGRVGEERLEGRHLSQVLPCFWASDTFYAHLAMGTDVLCLHGVLGGHDVHEGREELVVSGTRDPQGLQNCRVLSRFL